MPPRPPSLDVLRNKYICRSCLTNLARLAPPVPVQARFYAVRRRTSRRGPQHLNQPSQRPVPTEEISRKYPVPPDPEPEEEAADAEKPFVVRYYDEVAPGKLRRLKDNEEFNRVSQGLDDLETQMNELEEQMELTVKLMDQMPQVEVRDRFKEMSTKFRHLIHKQELMGLGRPQVELPPDPKQLAIPLRGLTGARQRSMNQLVWYMQDLMKKQDGRLGEEDFRRCWKLYTNNNRALVESVKLDVPMEVWRLLWSILSMDVPENKNRMHRIYVLTRDMRALNIQLNPFQQILALEAMFVEGWEKEAIGEWRKLVGTLGAISDAEDDRLVFQQYWELGVRMYSHHGDLERAQLAADKLLKSGVYFDRRVLLPLIRAMSRDESSAEQTWEIYSQVKELLGATITIEDYDEIIAGLLANNAVEMALHVFVDMMFSGTVSARGKQDQPSKVMNKFFIGKWLKRLIGEGDLDGAYRVLQYIQSKGVLLDAIQLNGLIGAWVRTDEAKNIQKAEKLAWAMIQARLVFVKLREQGEAHHWPMRFMEAQKSLKEEGEEKLTLVPRATAETFYLMAELYQKRQMSKDVQRVWKVFQQGKLNKDKDSFMMNRLITTALQDGKRDEAESIYYDMTKESNVPPDAHTFLFLFESLNINRLISTNSEAMREDRERGRRFFREMVTAKFSMDPTGRLKLPRTILFSFQKMQDWTSMIVAARAMRELLGFVATQKLMVELAVGTGAVRSQARPAKARVMNATLLVAQLVDRRAEVLKLEGRPLETLSAEEKAVELNIILEQMIRRRMGESQGEGARGPSLADIEEAAREMGVYEVVVKRDPAVIAKLRKPDMKPIWEG